MKNRILVLVACISLVASAALAHGGEEHVIGTVSKVTSEFITVKTIANTVTTVVVAPETKFMKGQSKTKAPNVW
jgi:hypothetical protein